MNAKKQVLKTLSVRELRLLAVVPLVCEKDSIEVFQKTILVALESKISRAEIKEVLIQLTIYAGFPKVLEAMKKLKIIFSDFDKKNKFIEEETQAFGIPQFNFFKLKKVQEALFNIDHDFAHFALLNAIPLNDRPSLSPKERALIILASDLCNGVFDGPFQIHTDMALQSGATPNELRELIDFIGNDLPIAVLSRAQQSLRLTF